MGMPAVMRQYSCSRYCSSTATDAPRAITRPARVLPVRAAVMQK